jgi:hypothetical protein
VIDSLNDFKVLSAVFVKNNPAYPVRQIISQGRFDAISLPATLMTSDSTGTVNSPLFGPAKAWNQIRISAQGDNPADSATIQVLGLGASGNTTLLSEIPVGVSQVTHQGYQLLHALSIIKLAGTVRSGSRRSIIAQYLSPVFGYVGIGRAAESENSVPKFQPGFF